MHDAIHESSGWYLIFRAPVRRTSASWKRTWSLGLEAVGELLAERIGSGICNPDHVLAHRMPGPGFSLKIAGRDLVALGHVMPAMSSQEAKHRVFRQVRIRSAQELGNLTRVARQIRGGLVLTGLGLGGRRGVEVLD